MAGVTEEVGDTARSAVSALAGTPVMLALVILQIFTLGAVTYSIYNRQNANTMIIHKLIDLCGLPKTESSAPKPFDGLDPPKPHHGELPGPPPQSPAQDPT
jgi:hypothetical protein